MLQSNGRETPADSRSNGLHVAMRRYELLSSGTRLMVVCKDKALGFVGYPADTMHILVANSWILVCQVRIKGGYSWPKVLSSLGG